PLDHLFAMSMPGATPAKSATAAKRTAAAGKKTGARTARAPSRQLFEDESLAFARFLAEANREDLKTPVVVGLVLDAYMRGQPETQAISMAKDLYTRTDLLEKAFLDWLRARPGCKTP